MPTKPAPRTSQPSAHPVRDAADALLRAAKECCHQHDRLALLNKVHADDTEFSAAWDVAEICEGQLAAQTARYEETAQLGRGAEPEELWKSANALWMACREYVRRHSAGNEAASRRKRHGAAELSEITMDYELELSARIAVKQAINAYAVFRPDAS